MASLSYHPCEQLLSNSSNVHIGLRGKLGSQFKGKELVLFCRKVLFQGLRVKVLGKKALSYTNYNSW